MIKSKEEMPQPERHIDLSGPEGNAFVLIAMAKDYAKQLGRDGNAIADEMMKGDYEDLIEVFDREFGTFITLYR